MLFYDRPSELSSTIPAMLASAAYTGGIMIVATAAHRSVLLDGLAELTDLEALERSNRLMTLDAQEALDALMLQGRPDPERFAEVIGSPVRLLGSAGPVTAFGEMVALLWEDGQFDAALELEDLWNELGAAVQLDLVCAYAASSVASGQRGEAACRHDHVIRRAAFESWGCELKSVSAARRFTTSTLREWGLPGIVPDAQILVTELVANAVAHAGTPLHVSLQERDAGVRIVVGDESPIPPTMGSPGLEDTGGRGLRLIDAVSSAWGHRRMDGVKRVWADLSVPA